GQLAGQFHATFQVLLTDRLIGDAVIELGGVDHVTRCGQVRGPMADVGAHTEDLLQHQGPGSVTGGGEPSVHRQRATFGGNGDAVGGGICRHNYQCAPEQAAAPATTGVLHSGPGVVGGRVHTGPMSESGELRLQRLVAQRLAGPAWAGPAEAVRHLGAVQAQDLPGSLTSVALRTTGRTVAQVREALDRGEIVRTWPMRGTLHLVPAEDAGWMAALTGERVTVGIRRRLREVGLEEASVARAETIAAEVLAAAESVSRAQ